MEQAAYELSVHEARERKARELEEAANLEALRLAEEEASFEAAAKELHGESSEENEDASSLTYGLGSPFPVTESDELLNQEYTSEQEIDQDETSDQDQKSNGITKHLI